MAGEKTIVYRAEDTPRQAHENGRAAQATGVPRTAIPMSYGTKKQRQAWCHGHDEQRLFGERRQ